MKIALAEKFDGIPGRWKVRAGGQEFEITAEWSIGNPDIRVYSVSSGGKLLGDHDHGRLDDALLFIQRSFLTEAVAA